MSAVIKDFYYRIPSSTYEYICTALADIPDEVVKKYQYKLRAIARKGCVYMEIQNV